MVILFAGFAVVFTDNALGTALIQRRDVREEDKSTVFWFSAALGARSGRRRRRWSRRRWRTSTASPMFAGSSSRSPWASSSTRWARLRWRCSSARCSSDGSSSARWLRRSSARSTGIAIALAGLRRLGDRRPAARRSGHLDGAALAADPWRPSLRLLDRQLQPPRRVRRQRLRAEHRLAERAKPQRNPDRTGAGRCGARRRTRSRRP